MKIDISYLDEWLQQNPEYSQEDRELIVEAIEEYEKTMNSKTYLEHIKEEICHLIDSDTITMSRGKELLLLTHTQMRELFNKFLRQKDKS